MSSSAFCCEWVSAVGQRLEDARAQPPFAGAAAAGLPAHMRAHQRQRELAGEQFVIGKPCPSGTFRRDIARFGRPMQMAQRVGEARKLFARHPGFILPFRQIGEAGERCIHRAPHIAERQSFGERIDRLDQWQLGEAFLVHDPVGMHHLQHAVVEFGAAGDVAQLTHRQKFLQVILARIEESQRQRSGLVAAIDLVGRARAVAAAPGGGGRR